MMSDISILEDIFLTDPIDGDEVRIINIRGAEHNLDHLEISTQTRAQKDVNLKTVHRIYTEEQDDE
jgi:hypothetical protein